MVCVRAARGAVECGLGESQHASWRGGLQALAVVVVVVVVGADGGERRDGDVDIRTVQTTEGETVHG